MEFPSHGVDSEHGGEGFAVSHVVSQGAPSTQPPSHGVPEYPKSSEDESEEDEPAEEDVRPTEPPRQPLFASWTSAEDIDAFLDDFTRSLPPLDPNEV